MRTVEQITKSIEGQVTCITEASSTPPSMNQINFPKLSFPTTRNDGAGVSTVDAQQVGLTPAGAQALAVFARGRELPNRSP